MTGRMDKRADKVDKQVDNLAAIDRLMRERGGLPSVPPPTPLHKMGDSDDNDHDTDDNTTTGERP